MSVDYGWCGGAGFVKRHVYCVYVQKEVISWRTVQRRVASIEHLLANFYVHDISV